MIVETNTKDKNGRIYKKIFSNFVQDAIYCNKGSNKVFSVKPNASIRLGDSKFGDQLIMQLTIVEERETYDANTNVRHMETYFKINKETQEYFQKIADKIGDELK